MNNLFLLDVKNEGVASRKKLNFWNVHGIMNTLGLLQSK